MADWLPLHPSAARTGSSHVTTNKHKTPMRFSLHSNVFILLFTFSSSYVRVEAGFQKVLQVDLEVNGLLDPLGSRSVTWQIEYPISRTLSDEIQTLIRLAPHDLGGIVPLAMVSLVILNKSKHALLFFCPLFIVTVCIQYYKFRYNIRCITLEMLMCHLKQQYD